MLTISIGMRTVYRPQQYVQQTLERLSAVGSLSHESVIGLHVHHGEGITPNRNGVCALRAAGMDDPDYVLFLEDDIDIIDDFIPSVLRWIGDHERSDVLFYPLGSFYDFITREQQWRELGAWHMPIGLYYGSQAVLFHREHAMDYANWLDARARGDASLPSTEWGSDAHFDMHLRDWQRARTGCEIIITPSPCFVNHIGQNSIMGDWQRTGFIRDFAGRDWRYNGGEHWRTGERSAVQGVSI